MFFVCVVGKEPDITPLNLGGPIHQCCFCGASIWFEERLKKPMRDNIPLFSLCCTEGKVRLPLFKETPSVMNRLIDYNGGRPSRCFRDNIRVYNSMFNLHHLVHESTRL